MKIGIIYKYKKSANQFIENNICTGHIYFRISSVYELIGKEIDLFILVDPENKIPKELLRTLKAIEAIKRKPEPLKSSPTLTGFHPDVIIRDDLSDSNKRVDDALRRFIEMGILSPKISLDGRELKRIL